jgi:hypothetical protein
LKTMRNPMLREEPRFEKAPVLPSNNREGILEWLQRSGKIVARQTTVASSEDEEEDIDDLFDDDDNEDAAVVEED